MFKNYLIIALRNFRRYKVISFINIAGLAIGLAMFMLIALYIQYELSYDKFHENGDRICRVEQILDHNTYKEASAGCPAALSKPLIADFPEFEAVSRVIPGGNFILTVADNQKIRQRVFYADSAFFTIFSFPRIKGDLATALDAPYSVVLTQAVAEKVFREQDPLGKTIRFDDDQDYKVTGVIQDVPQNSHFTFDLLISSVSITAGRDRDLFEAWHDNWVPLYVLLHPEQPWQKASEKIQFALKKYQGEESRHELYLRPLSRIHLYANVKHEFGLIGSIKNVYIFSAIAIFVLIIAAINFMNLTTARSAERAREVGLRKVLGARRTSLIRQFLGESISMALMAMLFAIILMDMFLHEFNRIVNRDLFLSFWENWPFALGFLFITLLVGLLSGIYPAFVLSSFKPANVLKGSFSSGSRNVFLRKALVVLQFFISVTLISGTVIILQQVNYLLHKDLGYNTEQILIFPAGSTDLDTYRIFQNQILQNPNVIHVATADYMMHSSTNWTRISWEGATEGDWMKINVNYIDEDFLKTYGMTVVEGRAFSKEYGSDQGNVVILNEAAVKEIGWEEPIGKNIRYGGDYKLNNIGLTEVVGVVKDYHFLSLHNSVTPMMLRLFPEDVTGWNVSVKVSGQDIPKSIAFIENKFNEFFPEDVFNYRFLDEDFNRMYSEERKSGKVILYLTLLAIFIACLGLFGLASFATKQRTKEIGIRKVIGATIPHIMWLLNSEFLKLTVLGCFLAWPVAYFVMDKWLQNFPYRVSIQWWVFLLSSLAACVVALLTISYQSIKSATANPVDSLRYE
ncbi:MAG: ABC transporter permease [Candidatus Aminicenantes bacterium]|nr:ABC transporter permease [Candidatus Aminicenantes bacterium]